MPTSRISREDFVAAYRSCGLNAAETARVLGVSVRNVQARLRRIEEEEGVAVRQRTVKVTVNRDTRPAPIDLKDGVVVVGSDAHYWPGEASTAHKGLVHVCRTLGPDIVVMNGDEFDGASVSRHAPLGWEAAPTVSQEIAVTAERLQEIKRASPGAAHLGTLGNHTRRFDMYLASHAAGVEGVPGMKLEDHLPGWDYAWAWMINDHTLVKHRIRGGVHATWNNTADAHINTVTGHCHALQVRPRTTMSPVNGGTIYGVDTGMLADPWGPQFAYLEQGPRNWRAGFAVLTFKNGFLMPPEVATVVGPDELFFRGKLITTK